MPEQDEIQPRPQDIEPATSQHVVSTGAQQEGAQVHEAMDLETARAVLQAIVDTHEDTFTETTPLDKIGGYTTEQIRQAEKKVAEGIIEQAGVKKSSLITDIEKETPDGILTLYLSDTAIRLNMETTTQHVLENEFALKEPGYARARIRFTDFRSGHPEETSLHDLNTNPTLEGFRKMVRGTRWMSANMLDWQNPTIIMPEQLDNKPLPPAQGTTPQPIE